MNVKAVTVFESEDGQRHESREAAMAHNAHAKVLDRVRKVLADPKFGGHTPAMIASSLVSDPALATGLRDALNKSLEFHRTYGKLKKVIHK